MSKLQNNYTTQKQSKRLLELGIPAWTADCFYPIKTSDMPIIIADIKVGFNLKYATPCWSVGRLIEIYEICTQTKFKRVQQTDSLVYLTLLEDVLMQIEHNACGFYDNTKWDTNLLNG